MGQSLDNHYTEMGIEPIVYSDSNNLDPYQHTIIKYVTRWRAKGKLRDLKAAALILQKYIDKEEALIKPHTDITHPDEAKALQSILNLIPSDHKYSSIVTSGRGGMWAAANIAYALGITDVRVIPLKEVTQIMTDDVLFVDDISDSGDTLKGIVIDSACLFTRETTDVWPTYTGEILHHEEYIYLGKSQQFDKEKHA